MPARLSHLLQLGEDGVEGFGCGCAVLEEGDDAFGGERDVDAGDVVLVAVKLNPTYSLFAVSWGETTCLVVVQSVRACSIAVRLVGKTILRIFEAVIDQRPFRKVSY